MRGLRIVPPALLAGLLAIGLAGCEDLLQEPDTGIATPIVLDVVGGEDQTAAPGATLAQPLRVRLVDTTGRSIDRLRIEWSVLGGGGRVTPRQSFTDVDGVAEATWTLGPVPGRQVVQARIGDETTTIEAIAQ